MFPSLHDYCLPLLVAFAVTVGTADAADAGWVTIRNNTNQIVVVQEIVVENGHVRRLKPVRLLPGESVRQSEPTTGVKHFELYDAQRPGTRLWAGELRVTEENQFFSVGIIASKPAIREETMVANTPRRP